MPRIPVVPAPVVYHVGTLDPGLRGTQHVVSYEGGGLSVSPCPDAWRSMASLTGPTLELRREGATWLDLAAMGPDLEGMAVGHAESAGLVEVRDAWSALYCEEGRDGWHARVCPDEAGAIDVALTWTDVVGPRASSVDDLLGRLPPGTPPPPGPLVSHGPVPLLTRAGDARALGFGTREPATGMAAAFWVEDVLSHAVEGLVGVWWRSRLDVAADLAPRGAVAPSLVGTFAASPAPAWSDAARMRLVGRTRLVDATLAPVPGRR